MTEGPEFVDEHHQRISEFAAEYLDDDEEREGFVDGLMERRGYQRSSHWTAPEQQQGSGPKPLLKAGSKRPAGQAAGQRSYFKK
jgi:hypothetical protein